MKRIRANYPKEGYYPRHPKDNFMRRYMACGRGSLEETIRKAIREERDEWRTPYTLEYVDDAQWNLPENERKYMRVYWKPEEQKTIRESLAEEDAKYRGTSVALRDTRIRVPSLKRSDREWMNFYRTWPGLAAQVATGYERFCDGAKLKYMPLFKAILDEEWPEDLKMWTEEEYDNLKSKGLISC